MKNMKNYVVMLSITSLIGLSGLSAYADQTIGVVDLYKVMNNYSKAQEISTSLTSKKQDLQKFQEAGNQQIKSGRSDLEKQNMFEKLNEEYNKKVSDYNQEVESKLKILKDIQDNEVSVVVEQVAKQKNIDVVLDKSNVPYSKIDITNEVLTVLNTKYKAATTSAK